MSPDEAESPILLVKVGNMTTSALASEPDILPPDYISPSDNSQDDRPPIEELLEVAGYKDIPDDEYGNLMTAPVPVKEAMAQNPHLQDPYLSGLIMESDYAQGYLLARNPCLTEQHIRMLYGRHGGLLSTLRQHPNAPEDLEETVFLKPHASENPFEE